MFIKVDTNWLEKINKDLDEQDIPDDQKARIAIWEWTKTVKNDAFKDQENTSKIKEWFHNRINHHSIKIGPEFIGCYYYDDFFWPLVIPIIYGRVVWKPHYSLKSTPPRLIDNLKSNINDYHNLANHYNYCNIYGREAKKLTKCKNPSRFLISADNQLKATITQILDGDTSSLVLESSRMTVELFMKAYIDMFIGLTDKDAKILGHNLLKCLNECKKLDHGTILSKLEDRLEHLPEINDRYKGHHHKNNDIWNAYVTAQFAGALLCRSYKIINTK